LAETGYEVVPRDLVPSHVDELLEEAARRGLSMDATVADARKLDLRDRSVDAVGLECLDIMSLEGLAFALPDLEERLDPPWTGRWF
jgi:hypothetical protein